MTSEKPKSTNWKWIQIVAGVIALVGTLLAFVFENYQSAKENVYIERQNYMLKRAIDDRILQDSLKYLIAKYESRINQVTANIDTTAKNTPNSESSELYTHLNFKISRLENSLDNIDNRLNKVSESTLALRQSINPLKPEEVLTIARLKDEITAIKTTLEQVTSNLDIRHEEFKAFVLREKDSSSTSTNLILVVLVPLVINFLYTVWKDFKKSSDKPDEEIETSPNKQ